MNAVKGCSHPERYVRRDVDSTLLGDKVLVPPRTRADAPVGGRLHLVEALSEDDRIGAGRFNAPSAGPPGVAC
jgi:hypothetical protein